MNILGYLKYYFPILVNVPDILYCCMNINHCNINKGTKPHKVVPPPSYKLAISPLTIDISPTKTRVKLELCSPTERYRTGAPPCKILIFLRSSNKTVATRRPGNGGLWCVPVLRCRSAGVPQLGTCATECKMG